MIDSNKSERKVFDPGRIRPPETEQLTELSERVIGAAIEVHRHLGPGFSELVYEEALSDEFELRKIAFSRQHRVNVNYKGRVVGEGVLDFLVDDQLVLELKSTDALSPVYVRQVVSYLKMTNYPVGLLINFNVDLLKNGIKRISL